MIAATLNAGDIHQADTMTSARFCKASAMKKLA
jgi:hypothetical protein